MSERKAKATRKAPIQNGTTTTGAQIEGVLGAFNAGMFGGQVDSDLSWAAAELIELLRDLYRPVQTRRVELLRSLTGGDSIDSSHENWTKYVTEMSKVLDREIRVPADRVSLPLPLRFPRPAKSDPTVVAGVLSAKALVVFEQPKKAEG